MRKSHLLAVAAATALAGTTFPAEYSVPGTFSTIENALVFAVPGDTILVGSGNFAGCLISSPGVTIKGTGGTVINSGPAHSSGMSQGFRLLAGSNGTTLSHLTFTTDLSIMNGGAVNDVTVTQCTFLNSVQAVSNWVGNGWEITHNKIHDLRTNNGGGIGILLADYTGGENVQNNVVSHNTIDGVLTSMAGESGGYNGSGIVVYADYRWGRTGASLIGYNRIVKNKIALTDNAGPNVDVVAFELTEARDDTSFAYVIHDNAIGFNDFRGTSNQIVLTPNDLDLSNDISRNLGENRGQGLHPGAFGPGGN